MFSIQGLQDQTAVNWQCEIEVRSRNLARAT